VAKNRPNNQEVSEWPWLSYVVSVRTRTETGVSNAETTFTVTVQWLSCVLSVHTKTEINALCAKIIFTMMAQWLSCVPSVHTKTEINASNASGICKRLRTEEKERAAGER